MLVVSACLAGIPCRYDGAARPDQEIVELVRTGRAVPVCAEVLGGLPTPRPPAEIVGGDGADVRDGRAKVVTADGLDVTEAFLRGARAAADVAIGAGARRAILHARSPSCGCGTIYDGTFTGTPRMGDGVAAAEFRQRGIHVEERRGSRPS